jgi:hypothetical protein
MFYMQFVAFRGNTVVGQGGHLSETAEELDEKFFTLGHDYLRTFAGDKVSVFLFDPNEEVFHKKGEFKEENGELVYLPTDPVNVVKVSGKIE